MHKNIFLASYPKSGNTWLRSIIGNIYNFDKEFSLNDVKSIPLLSIKKHFSEEELKLLIEIVKGKQDFEVMGEQIKDFYSDEYNEDDLTDKDDDFDWLRNDLLEKLEFDLEVGGVI